MKIDQPVSIIIKAYNEEANLGRVLKVLAKIDWIDEVIVVNDGSEDGTAEVAKSFENDKIRLVSNPKNLGMGGAMATGVKNARHNLVLFLDADLVGLTERHLLAILAPIIFTKEADLVLGVFTLKDLSHDTGTKIANRFSPLISGQRAVWKSCLPDLQKISDSRYGADLLIAKHIPKQRREVVKLEGLSQVTKEKKANGDLMKAIQARIKMYKEVIAVMGENKSKVKSKNFNSKFNN